MPYLAGLILNGLLEICTSLAGRALIGLGFGLATYGGFNAAINYFKNQAVNAALGLPSEIVQLMAYMSVGSFISLIFSAFTARMLLDGLQGDTIKKWVTK